MMNPPRRERPVESVVRNLRLHRDLVIATLFLLIGFLMGKI
jgi:hypothetical protein